MNLSPPSVRSVLTPDNYCQNWLNDGDKPHRQAVRSVVGREIVCFMRLLRLQEKQTNKKNPSNICQKNLRTARPTPDFYVFLTEST